MMWGLKAIRWQRGVGWCWAVFSLLGLAWGEPPEPSEVSRYLYVDSTVPVRAESDGSKEKPFSALAQAWPQVRVYLESGEGVMLELAEGEYHESAVLVDWQVPEGTPLIIRGAQPGKVLWRGENVAAAGTQAPLLRAEGLSWLALRALVFTGSQYERGAVMLDEGSFWECTQCVFSQNVGVGLSLRHGEQVNLSTVKFLDNGDTGLHAYELKHFSANGLSAERNGGMGVLLEYGANVQLTYLRIIENVKAGLSAWDGAGFLSLQNGFWAKNGGNGVEVFDWEGVLAMQDCETSFNSGAGLHLQTPYAQLQHNIWVGNGRPGKGQEPLGQLVIREGLEGLQQHIVRDNIVQGVEPGVPLVDWPVLDDLPKRLQWDQNLYYQASGQSLFRVLHVGLGLSRWQWLTGQDLNSHEGDPLFFDIKEYDYQMFMESPWMARSSWTEGAAADDVTQAWLGFLTDLREHRGNPLAWSQGEREDLRWQAVSLGRSAAWGRGRVEAWPDVINQPFLELYGVPFHNVYATLWPYQQEEFAEDDEGESIDIAWRLVSSEVEGQKSCWQRVVTMPVERVQTAAVLWSCDVVAGESSLGEWVWCYEDGGEVVVPIRVPGQEIPWELAPYYEALNEWHVQSYQAERFHFRNAGTEPVPLWVSKDSDVHGDKVIYLYVTRWDNPRPNRALKHVLWRVGYGQQSRVVVYALTVKEKTFF